MRKLRCKQVSGLNVQEILDEFNERAEEFGIKEDDVLGVSVLPSEPGDWLATPKGKVRAKVQIVLTYWADK